MSRMNTFTQDTYAFLSELRANNTRSWFEENKSLYEQHVKAPMISFIGSFATPLEEISKDMVADTRLNGGSMFRIHRDVRFSKNKDPYKTHAAAQFRHTMAKDVHAPCYYFQVAPGESRFGAGIWRPDCKSVSAIRKHIDANQKEWIKITSDEEFQKESSFSGDFLQRPPRGFDADHPLVEDLKRKDFIVMKQVPDTTILDDNLTGIYQSWCSTCANFMQFICKALEIPFQE